MPGTYWGQQPNPSAPIWQAQQGQAAPNGNPNPGRDPYRPFNQPELPPVRTEQFAPPRNNATMWVALASILFITILVAVSALVRSDSPGPTPVPTPIASKRSSPQSDSGNGIPFESSGSKGYWQIDKSSWDGETLTVTMTLRVDEGTLNYAFYAYNNNGASVVDPRYPSSGGFRPGTMKAGQSNSGTVQFVLHKADTTVILATGSGRQIAGLLVKP